MQDGHEIQAEKRALRGALRAQREALAPPAGSEAARAAGAEAARWLGGLLRGARGVALYQPYGREFDASPIGALAEAGGASLAFPRVASRRPPRLTFHALRKPGRASYYGALEPAEDEPELEDIDVFIVPGLGFDAEGRRLGQGGGFYDSALRARPSALRVAPCYDFQVIEAIPCEPHDEPVDVIVTPAGARRTGARPRPGHESEEV